MAYGKAIFSVELKSLALFRIGLALVCVFSLLGSPLSGERAGLSSQLGDFSNGLTGLLPLLEQGAGYGTYPVVIGIIITSLGLLLGYRTRLTTVLCFCLCGVATLYGVGQFRGVGNFLLPMLFWSVFLPLGATYSLDSAMTLTRPPATVVLSSATVALVIQQGLNYWMVGGFLQSPFLRANWPQLTDWSPTCFMALGVLGPLLLLIPKHTDLCRRIVVPLPIGFHLLAALGFGQPMLLAWLAMVTWLVYIPRSVWQLGERAIATPARGGLAIYYDADCGFCKKVVHVLRTLLILPGTPLKTAQSDPSICQDMETHNSWVVVDWTQKRHFKFAAIAYICSLSPLFYCLAPLLRWRPVMSAGTRFYETIANNRKRAALLTKFLTFKSHAVGVSALENCLVGALLTAVVILNVHAILLDYQ